MSGLEIRIHRDIAEVDAEEWDSLLGADDLLMTHRFIRTCQAARVEDAQYWHLLIRSGGELVCVGTLHRMFVNLELLSGAGTRALVEKVKGRWPGFLRLPVLFCGLPVSTGQPCLKIRADADAERICAAIAETMDNIAATTATRLLCFKEFDPPAAKRIDGALSDGYFRASSLPSCSVPLHFDSFSSYLASMRSSYRRQVRSSLQARAASGLQVRRLDDYDVETVYGLYSQTIRRAEHRLETLNADFFRLLHAHLGEQVKALVIERESRPLAMAIMLFAGETATFFFAGLEEERQPEWHLYQNLVAEVVAAAIDSGARRLVLGQTSYAMKSRMGAEESPRYLYLRYRSRVGHALLRGFSSALFPTYDYPRRRVFAAPHPPSAPSPLAEGSRISPVGSGLREAPGEGAR
ncbi:MAG TPA: GNAT family N-acetyltransferase [Thermoanaerobaculia bacterium]|nr:GNAT family N-acetyltransferase [Thermoanaerobaculia bacterium]